MYKAGSCIVETILLFRTIDVFCRFQFMLLAIERRSVTIIIALPKIACNPCPLSEHPDSHADLQFDASDRHVSL